MIERLSKESVTNTAAIVITLVVIVTGLQGLISVLFLMLISRLNIGRDQELKHGVATGSSRLGGIAIIFSLLSGIIFNLYLDNSLLLSNLSKYIDNILLFSILIGLIGLYEDLNQNLTSFIRLLLILIFVGVALALMPQLIPFDLPIFAGINEKNNFIFIYLFTVVMIAGFINAGNIADGANGLFPSICLAFFIVCFLIEPSIFYVSLIVSLLTFTIYNVSTGRIFLGDFGAYFLSAIVAFSSLNIFMNYDVSVFLFASILVYPCFELIRSLLVRFFNNKAIMSPDNNHLHNLVNHCLLSWGFSMHKANSMTGLGLALISSGPPLCMIYLKVQPTDNLWFYLLFFQLLYLSIIYMFLGKLFQRKRDSLL